MSEIVSALLYPVETFVIIGEAERRDAKALGLAERKGRVERSRAFVALHQRAEAAQW